MYYNKILDFNRTGSPSISLGYAEPQVDGSSIMNFVVSVSKIWNVFFLVKMWYILNYYISNFLCCPKQIAIILVTHIFTKSCLAKANSTIIHVYARYFFFKILIPSINVPFQLSSRFPDTIARLLPGSGRYQILYTDYDNFAILWSCANFGIAYTGVHLNQITIIINLLCVYFLQIKYGFLGGTKTLMLRRGRLSTMHWSNQDSAPIAWFYPEIKTARPYSSESK